MPEEKLRDVVPDADYRALMRKLSSLLSSLEDIYELKYMLKCRIPAGKRVDSVELYKYSIFWKILNFSVQLNFIDFTDYFKKWKSPI